MTRRRLSRPIRLILGLPAAALAVYLALWLLEFYFPVGMLVTPFLIVGIILLCVWMRGHE